MTDRHPRFEVVRVAGDGWRTYRDVRLAALIDSPRAFWTTYAEAAARTEEEWRQLAGRITAWLALDAGRPAGTVGLWHGEEQPADEAFLVGMWVASSYRGSGVAEQLVDVALEHARDAGYRRVVLDVAHENARARAFYTRLGFRATGEVGAMPWDPSVTEETMARDLPFGS